MGKLIQVEYQGAPVHFNDAGWFNATREAERFGKRPVDWLALDSTREYIATLAEVSNCEKSSLLKTKRGRHQGGTWMHPRLAVAFARWLDTRFAVWCDLQIDGIIRGDHACYDQRRARDAAAASFKVMNEVLKLARQDEGKSTGPHHFINEARLVNWALTGRFEGLDRDALTPGELALLASLEERNTVLLGRGVAYASRKLLLEQHALDWRASAGRAGQTLVQGVPAIALPLAAGGSNHAPH